jgi:hypothetical protein
MDASTLLPLNNWCHPFKDIRDPLAQLTHMANAAAGYYPLGRSGLLHGGVHFDAGTAGVLDQSSVHCLADGEVVAYRIDTNAPTTHFINASPVAKPFSRNFVLVRHRLQAPTLEGSAQTPPGLTFYSLSMHLRDWQAYQDDSAIARPAFWPQGPTLRVKQTVNDVLADVSDQPGLNVRHSERLGQVIDLLPRGAEVVVSGSGRYRTLENRPGPRKLINADGSLAGYLSASALQRMAGNQYRIKSSKAWVNVRAEPKNPCQTLMQLPTGTVVTVSGEGEFRKLERVHQYLHFDSLEGAQAPLATDRIVVLEQPVPIKAGDLIGHLGNYQDCHADLPEQKLHLEVFSGDDIDVFLAHSRSWAQRLPDSHKTWLKLARGTAVVAAVDNVTAALLTTMIDDSPVSAADLLLPKSLLDRLPAKDKLAAPATPGHKARNWYRLDGLLHDADNTLLNGWVCEEVGVTPWLSPWSWEGYDVLSDDGLPTRATALLCSAFERLSDAQRQRVRPRAETHNNGPMKNRLYEIIDPARVGHPTAEALQAALRLPAHAQALSQIILRKQSEWFHRPQKWHALEEWLGHSSSSTQLNGLAEKQRMEQMSWWAEVAEKVGLPAWGTLCHFHPVGLVGLFARKNTSTWKLGTTSERYESGGRGPGVVSTGSGDRGGVSYGIYQMSSKMGVVQKFIEQSAYRDMFAGLDAGTRKFTETWKRIAKNHPQAFRAAQHDYIKNTHYAVQMDAVLDAIDFPVANKSAALHDMVWSTSVQFGPRTELITRALHGLSPASMSVNDIICAVQDYKISRISSLFSRSPLFQPRMYARAVDEKRTLLELAMSGAEIE